MRRLDLRVLSVVCLGTFFHIQSIGSISVSLAAIQKHFDTTLSAVQWIGLMGAIMICSLSLLSGRAGDLLGRRAVFKIGLTCYAAGAGLAALAESFPQLLIFRTIMALGLAMAAPLAGAIVASAHFPESRGRALGWLAASTALGRTTGPSIGGFIIHVWGWRAVFLANCIFGLLICLTLFLVLRGKEERRSVPVDLWGGIFLMVGFPALLVGISLGPRFNGSASEIALWLAIAAAAGVALVRCELRAEAPLMNLRYFLNPDFRRALVSLVLATLAFYPVTIFGPLYLLNVLGASPLRAGLVMAALPFWTTLMSPVSGRLADRFEPRWVAVTGLIAIVCGLFLYARLDARPALIWMLIVLSFLGAGIGLFLSANEKAAFSAVPTRDYSMTSAMLTGFGTGAGALGTTAAVALAELSNRYRLGAEGGGFASDQQFAFYCLLPLAALAVLLSLGAGKSNPPSYATPPVDHDRRY